MRFSPRWSGSLVKLCVIPIPDVCTALRIVCLAAGSQEDQLRPVHDGALAHCIRQKAASAAAGAGGARLRGPDPELSLCSCRPAACA